MNEHEFLRILEERAKEQEKIIRGMFLPQIFTLVNFWVGTHPWKFIIPIAIILTLVFHYAIGKPYDDFILKIFGKL